MQSCGPPGIEFVDQWYRFYRTIQIKYILKEYVISNVAIGFSPSSG